MALLRLSSFARTLRLSQFKFAPRSFAAAAGGSAKQIDKIINGNSAASYVAYGLSENIMIFPITPSSQMGDQVDAFAADGLKNCLGNSVKVVQMQSEGGAGGALHGCASSGALSSTFTCSQGLLLFIPNMYLLAGELTPAVFHVSARTLSKHALSIFGDHSDVMAVRSTGFSILSSANPQEVHDMAIVAHIAALNGSLPVLHFFDGFRTSHTAMNVKVLPYEEMRPIFPTAAVEKNLHEKALNSTRPMHRGTGQRTDIFMQNTIAGRGHFLAMPDIVQETMDQLMGLTGRQYSVFEYVGHPEAERVMVIMGSSAKTVRCTLGALPGDEKVGMVNVRLYRPWDAKRFLDALPSWRAVARTERTCTLTTTRS
jgi:pyruvate-ferredoxin/flavodoxin oxidoreductase